MSRAIWVTLLPVALVSLGVLAIAFVPLAWSAAVRARGRERARARAAHEADAELRAARVQIAAELQSGVVRDLSTVAEELNAAAVSDAKTDAELSATLRCAAGVCGDGSRKLQEILADLAPPGSRASAPPRR